MCWNIRGPLLLPVVGQKRQEPRDYPLTVSKGESWCIPNRVDLWFRRTKRQCSWSRQLEGLHKSCKLSLMSLVHLTKQKEWVWSAQWKFCKTSQMVQTCGSNWPVKWESWSFWSLRGVPQMGIMFSKRTLATEEAVTCLQGKVSVWCENIPTMTKTHPLSGGSCKESYFQCLDSPLRQFKMSRRSTASLLWGVFWTSGPSGFKDDIQLKIAKLTQAWYTSYTIRELQMKRNR